MRTTVGAKEQDNPVAAYCLAFESSGMKPREFARRFYARWPSKVLEIIEAIGSWPSSEPELRALQELYP